VVVGLHAMHVAGWGRGEAHGVGACVESVWRHGVGEDGPLLLHWWDGVGQWLWARLASRGVCACRSAGGLHRAVAVARLDLLPTAYVGSPSTSRSVGGPVHGVATS
jgi:hypothetical protein